MRNDKAELHDLLQHNIAVKLRRQGYRMVMEDVPYQSNGYTGQIDVLAFSDHWEFHETKCGDGRHSRNKAKEQYERARAAFPELDLQGYLHTMSGSYRL